MRPVLRLLRTASFGFAALYVLLFAISACILGVAVFVVARSSLEQQLAAEVQSDSAFLQEQYRSGGLRHLQMLINARGHEPSAPDYLLQTAEGTRLAGEIPLQPHLRPGWINLATDEGTTDHEPSEQVRALVVDLGGGLLLAVGDDLSRIAQVEEAIATAFAWAVGLAVVLGIGGGVLLSRAFLARVDAIGRTAEAIIAGDLARRIPVRGGGDDLDRLAGTLNHMLDRIHALMESLRQVSSDIAHDLRTPLSRLYQKLDDARDNARSVTDYQHAVLGALADAEALMETFSALLRIAQVEGASPRSAFRDVDISAVIDAVVDAYRPDAEDAGHVIEADAEPGIIVHGDRELLTQAVANLVENVLRHTPSGTVMRLQLRRERAGCWLTVEDDGPGVAVDDLPRLTHRFYRGERSRTTVGNGLGLSLVSAVAELHGCRLAIESLSPGLRVSLHFRATVCSNAPPAVPIRGAI
ncbi:MAG: HAMP domain-containing protein [Proteobacteria bacterium]|nr:HAMP domain-containing protein [Pseudomonadota bacterium]